MKKVLVRQQVLGSCEDLAAALARQRGILPMNSITVIELARQKAEQPLLAAPEARGKSEPPPILIFALAVLAALGAWGIVAVWEALP